MDKVIANIISIRAINYRNYDLFDLEFDEGLNFISGNNGQGKTNIIDAIYYTCFTKSYFNTSDVLTIKDGKDFFRLESKAQSGIHNLDIVFKSLRGKKKEFELNGVKVEKFSTWIGQMPCVMIAPNDIELIFGGSEGRRKFMDATLSQVDGNYLLLLSSYNRYLVQRNAVLKNFYRGDIVQNEMLIEAYNQKINEFGDKIFQLRRSFIEEFLVYFNSIYIQISGKEELASIRYESDFLSNNFEVLIKNAFEKDKILQRTTVGIHCDDLEFQLFNLPLKKTASQGQQKTFLLALKLAQFNFIEYKLGLKPILLLDDIFDKFDEFRSAFILKLLSSGNFGQVFVTDANEVRILKYLENTLKYKFFIVKNQQIEERRFNK